MIIKGIQFYWTFICVTLLICYADSNFITCFIFMGISIFNIIMLRNIWNSSTMEERYIYTGAKWFKDKFNIDLLNEE